MKWNNPVIDLLCLTAFWLLSLVVVNPTGNFPLIDDWAYALTVKHLLATGTYQPSGWAGMILIANVLWGSAFCLLAGFSFVVLRFSTLFAAWLGILSVYWLMRECRQPRGVTLTRNLGFSLRSDLLRSLEHVHDGCPLYRHGGLCGHFFSERNRASVQRLPILGHAFFPCGCHVSSGWTRRAPGLRHRIHPATGREGARGFPRRHAFDFVCCGLDRF